MSKSCVHLLYILIISYKIWYLKCCEHFIIGNAQSTIAGFNLLSLQELNNPAIKASLIHQYNQLKGLRVSVSWNPGNTCLVTSTVNNYNGIKSDNKIIYLYYNSAAGKPSYVYSSSQYKIGDLEGRFEYDFDELTNTSCIVNNNPGIFGKNCGVNRRLTLTKPGIYNYYYSSSQRYISSPYGAHAKYHIEFIISGFTCYNPTITVQTSNHDYAYTYEDLLVTYIYGKNSSEMTQVRRCGRYHDTFCSSSVKPGGLCNVYGQTSSTTTCNRNYACPQYYTPTNEWSNGSTYGFVITNGIYVGLQGCSYSMNIEFILSCATNRETITNDASITSYVYNTYTVHATFTHTNVKNLGLFASAEANAQYLISYYASTTCVNPKITLRTQTGDYDNLNNEHMDLYYDSANPKLIKKCGYGSSNYYFCDVNNGNICNSNIGLSNTCYISASCVYEYSMTTFPAGTYQLFRIRNGAEVTTGHHCVNSMLIAITLACGSANTPLYTTDNPTEHSTSIPSTSPTNIPTSKPTLTPIQTIYPTSTPSNNPTFTLPTLPNISNITTSSATKIPTINNIETQHPSESNIVSDSGALSFLNLTTEQKHLIIIFLVVIIIMCCILLCVGGIYFKLKIKNTNIRVQSQTPDTQTPTIIDSEINAMKESISKMAKDMETIKETTKTVYETMTSNTNTNTNQNANHKENEPFLDGNSQINI